jgi:hypothetical protein
MRMDHLWNGSFWRNTKVLREVPVPLPLCPPKITHRLTWNLTRASAVKGRRLTALIRAAQHAAVDKTFAALVNLTVSNNII